VLQHLNACLGSAMVKVDHALLAPVATTVRHEFQLIADG
jgi:hypothetical protein